MLQTIHRPFFFLCLVRLWIHQRALLLAVTDVVWPWRITWWALFLHARSGDVRFCSYAAWLSNCLLAGGYSFQLLSSIHFTPSDKWVKCSLRSPVSCSIQTSAGPADGWDKNLMARKKEFEHDACLWALEIQLRVRTNDAMLFIAAEEETLAMGWMPEEEGLYERATNFAGEAAIVTATVFILGKVCASLLA